MAGRRLYIAFNDIRGRGFVASSRPNWQAAMYGAMEVSGGRVLHRTYHQLIPRGEAVRRRTRAIDRRAMELLREEVGDRFGEVIVEHEFAGMDNFVIPVLRTTEGITASTARALGRRVAARLGDGWRGSFVDSYPTIQDDLFGRETYHECVVIAMIRGESE